jgi:hypothetical protein
MTPAKALARKQAREPQFQLVVLHRATRPGFLRRGVNSVMRMALLMRSPGPAFRWAMAKRRALRERTLVAHAGSCTRPAQVNPGHEVVEEKNLATASFWL